MGLFRVWPWLVALAALLTPPAQAQQDQVKVGINGFISDTPLFIANEKGFFKQQGLDVTLTDMTTGGQMTAPLAAGQLDVGAGSVSVGLFNSALRGIGSKVVADKSRIAARSTYLQLILRKGVTDRVKSFADLKGLKIGVNGKWGVQASTVNEFLKAGKLKFTDAEIVWNLSNPQQIVALTNGGIDAALNAEPAASQAIAAGTAVAFANTSQVYPDQEFSVLVYGEKFIKERRAVATRFMIAYLQGVRTYNDALVDGFIKGPGAAEVIDIIARNTIVKDKVLLARVGSNGCDPDGNVNIDGMNKDIAFFKEHKVLEGDVKAEMLVDDSFARQAVAQLGPYQRKR